MEPYAIRGGLEGYERLKLLARDRWPATSEFLERVGVGSGMHCLDLGCGGGEVSFEIARIVGPDGDVTGIDMDQVKLGLGAAAAAERGLANVHFRAADVNQWDQPGSYDLVYCRFLLQHLRRPVDLLQRMWAAVRPGGVLAVEDADFDGLFCEPPNAGFDFYSSTYPRLLAKRGGDPTLGRKLYRYFLQVGIPDPSWTMVNAADCGGPGTLLALSTLEATADAMLAEQLVSEKQMSAALASLAEFIEDPIAMVGGPRIFQVWARRGG